MDNNQKEFYIKKVEKYNQDLNLGKRSIILSSLTLAVAGIYILLNIAGMVSEQPLVRYALHISMASVSLGSIVSLITSLAEKAGMEARIDEIKEFFRQNGLDLTNEMANRRNR